MISMSINWYEKFFPTVGESTPVASDIAKQLKEISGVKEVYAWGSLGEHYEDENYHIKDIDLLVKTEFCSGDLEAVTASVIGQGLKDEALEDDGFNPDAVRFSKKFLGIDIPLLDRWVISSDKKLLHWGAMVSMEEADEVKKEAEEYAESKSGLDRKKVKKAAKSKRSGWYESYKTYMSKQVPDSPSGWYPSDVADIDDIIASGKVL